MTTPAPTVVEGPALRWVLIALTAATLAIGWPFWPPLVLAAWTATLARPLLHRIEARFSGRPRAAAALALALFVVLALPVGLLLLGVIAGVEELVALVSTAPSARDALASIAADEGAGPTHFPSSPAEFVELAKRYGGQGAELLSTVAGAAMNGLVALFLYFAGSFVLLVEGPAAWRWTIAHTPLAPTTLRRLGDAFHETGRGLLIGVGLTCLAQAVVATLIFVAMGVPRWWVLGPMTGIAAVLPVVGSAFVWGPIALGFAFTDHLLKAGLLVLLGVGVISSVDNLLRPVFSRFGALQMPTFLLFVSLFGGLATFGTWGAMLGPLVVRLWLEAMVIYREASTGAPVREAPPLVANVPPSA